MSEPDKLPSAKSAPFPAAALTWLGLLPFLAAALIALFANKPEQRDLGLRAFSGYGAIILSFLGGVRWGAALARPNWRLLVNAVLPSLVAFGCLLLDARVAIPMLAICFLVVGIGDWARGTHALWPAWFKHLRVQLSIAVLMLHLVLFVAQKQL